MGKIKDDFRPLGDPNSWAKTYGTYLAGQAAIDGVDHLVKAMETKWGADRLRLLVGNNLREKFDRQRFLWNRAIWHGDLNELQIQASRTMAAWSALDRAAEGMGALKLDPAVLEFVMPDGVVVAIVADRSAAHLVMAQGREVIVFSHDELVTILQHYREIRDVKAIFPGATVTCVRREISDPLLNIREATDFDERMGDQLPNLGV